jgi:hypothetical protein
MYSSPRFIVYGLMPWMGPDSRSWRARRFAGAALRGGAELRCATLFTPRFFEVDVVRAVAFLEVDFFFVAFFGAALRDGDFAAADFFDAFFFAVAFFGLLAALCDADLFAVTFFRDAFLAAVFLADFFADLPAALRATVFFDVFFRAAVLLFDVAFTLDFFRLTLRLLPVDFLLPAALRDAAFFRLAPALFRFLLAAFFAGIPGTCGD